MIKTSLKNIINSIEVFNEIINQPFKGSLAFKIFRLIRELNKEMESFNKARLKIIFKYCEKNENGENIIGENKNVKISPNNIEQCNQEIKNLLNEEIEINVEKIPFNCLDEITLTPQQILNIETFFE